MLCNCMFFFLILGDLYPESEKGKDQEEPEWVKNERDHFNEFRDKNKDGKMDRVCLHGFFMIVCTFWFLLHCISHFH